MTAGDRSVVIVGGGVAGLVASLELSHRGMDVVLLERQSRVGGKMRTVSIDGREIDVGPTVLTMRWVFQQIFDDVGETLEDHLALEQADVIARHAWTDGARLDLFGDADRSASAIQEHFGAAEAEGFRRFCRYAKNIYDSAEHAFILSPSPRFGHISRRMGAGGLRHLMRLDSMRTMDRSLGRFFGDPRLRQLFGRYATYYGSSPFLAPGTLNLIAHVEMQGVWFVKGGMYRVAETLGESARARGARIRTGAAVSAVLVEGGRARGVVLDDGEEIRADAVVLNADVSAIASGGLGPDIARAVKAPAPAQRSLSAFNIATVARSSGFELSGHNVFFSDDYRAEFDDILERRTLPAQPTVYIRAQDRDGGAPADGEPDRLFFIINAPPDADRRPLSQAEMDQCTQRTFQHIESCGLRIETDPRKTVTFSPADFERLFPGTGGAIYGRATHSWRASMQRSGPRTDLPGLYLAGGSVHPGAGVPMASMGGRLAASLVLEDLDSTPLSPLRGTRGGTSTA